MKLFYAKGSCSLAVRIVLHEIGISSEFEAVDLKTKKTATGADYLTINFKGAVPALLTDEKHILTENSIIQQYIADTHHATHLLPAVSDFQRYRVLEALNFVSTEMHKGCSPLFHPKLSDEIKNQVFVPLIKARLNFATQLLERHDYLAGSQFSLADSYFFTVCSWFRGSLQRFNIHLADFPLVEKHFNTVKSRPSVQRALEEEGLVALLN